MLQKGQYYLTKKINIVTDVDNTIKTKTAASMVRIFYICSVTGLLGLFMPHGFHIHPFTFYGGPTDYFVQIVV